MFGCLSSRAQDDRDAKSLGISATPREKSNAAHSSAARSSRPTATIHWQGVPLRDAIARLQPLFDEPVFVDRRVNPDMKVTLDIAAQSAEQVLAGIATDQELGVARLGRLVYLGPKAAAEQLRPLATLRTREVARLPADVRTALMSRKQLSWPRLSEPRQIVSDVVGQSGWRITNPDQIPHDLWAANELPELSVAEQLTALLIGFDLTFELRAADRSIQIVPIVGASSLRPTHAAPSRSTATAAAKHPTGTTKQVYTLRVQEKPVGAVLHELATRLHWSIQIDEDAIRAAGKSMDQRVSFSVDNADQDKLLDALLTPAGLKYQLDGEQIKITPRSEGDK
ncbi:MAG TPA: hypothetical protein VHU84_13750 [Lacipirellulaceae bacterium]|nr:hypothetical protein [Lacipirellulaceae bacterium]